MTPTSPSPAAPAHDYAALWSSARKLYPIYVEMAREFAVEAPGFAALDEPADSPDQETVEQAQKWLNDLDDRIQVHQLRQFLQTNTHVDNEGVITLIQHFLGKAPRVDSADEREVGGRRCADVETVGGQRPIPRTRERVRGRVLLPDDLEGSLGLRHEPSRVGARADLPRPSLGQTAEARSQVAVRAGLEAIV